MSRSRFQHEVPPPQIIDDLTVIGRFVRAQRKEARIGIHDAAAMCGVAVLTMQKLEKGGDVRLSTVLKVTKMLGIKLRIETS